jgi:hypothetical protein
MSEHECCESCIQDIWWGFGEDLIDMGLCCCKMEREEREKTT